MFLTKRAVAIAIALLALATAVAGCESGGGIGGPTAAPASASATTQRPPTLLERYVPRLRYDGQEEFFATSPAAVAEHPDAALRHGGPSGQVIASGAGEPERLSLGFLAAQRYANGQAVGREDTITVAADYGGWAGRRDELARHGDVVYGRTVTGSDGRTWLTYWFFYVFNDSLPALGDTGPGSLGDHEGDWEVVAIKLDAHGQEPELVVYSQHRGAQALPWAEVETVDGHPVLYPGRGTHAGMFQAGCHWSDTGAWRDCNDGDGRQVTPTLRALDRPWATWPGHWGTIAAPCTTGHWNDPAALLR